MNKLTAAMRIVLANVFIMYFKAHAAHWNVEGPMFSQYHEFFGDLYDEFKTLFAGMGADYNQLFPELEALAKQIAKIEAIRSQSGGGGGSTTKKPVAPGGGGGQDQIIPMVPQTRLGIRQCQIRKVVVSLVE